MILQHQWTHLLYLGAFLMSSRSTIQATPITNSRHLELVRIRHQVVHQVLNPVHMGNVVPQNVLDLCVQHICEHSWLAAYQAKLHGVENPRSPQASRCQPR